MEAAVGREESGLGALRRLGIMLLWVVLRMVLLRSVHLRLVRHLSVLPVLLLLGGSHCCLMWTWW